jgi:hypothetical protein
MHVIKKQSFKDDLKKETRFAPLEIDHLANSINDEKVISIIRSIW